MARKIKIVWVQSYTDDYDTRLVMRGVPEDDFEEVSDEEYQLIRQNLHTVPRPSYDLEPRIVELDRVPVIERLESIKEHVRRYEEQRQAQLARQKVSREKAKQTKLQKEKAKFEELKKKFESSAEANLEP